MNKRVIGSALAVALTGNCVCMAASADNVEFAAEQALPSVSANMVEQSPNVSVEADGNAASVENAETELLTEATETPSAVPVSEDEGEISPLSDENSWDAKASMNSERAYFNSFVLNDGLYIVGGLNSDGYVSGIDKYNDENDEWQSVTEITDMPKGFAAAGNGDKIYIAGGYRDGEWINETRAYDTTTGEWSDLPGMTEKRDQAAALYLDNKLYVFGGRNELGIVDSYEYYDFDTGTWSEVTTGYASSLIRIGARVNYLNGYVLMCGGVGTDYEYCGSDIYSAADLKDTQNVTSYSEKSIVAVTGEDKAVIFSSDTVELTIDGSHVGTAQSGLSRDNTIYEDYALYNGYLYRIGGFSKSGYYKTSVLKYSTYVGDYSSGDGTITDDVTADGNEITLNIEAGKEYMLFINVSDITSYDDYRFTVEYPEGSLVLEDACAMTASKDTQTGAIYGTDINVTAASDDGLTFECTEEIADGNSVTETVNAVLLKAQISGQVTIKYAMVQE